jgi:hypothetical protein
MTTGRINQITIVVLQGGDRALRGGKERSSAPSSLVTVFCPCHLRLGPPTPREPSSKSLSQRVAGGPFLPHVDGKRRISLLTAGHALESNAVRFPSCRGRTLQDGRALVSGWPGLSEASLSSVTVRAAGMHAGSLVRPSQPGIH